MNNENNNPVQEEGGTTNYPKVKTHVRSNDKLISMMTQLPTSMKLRLEAACDATGLSQSEYVRRAIWDRLQKESR